jgi:nitroreductase
MPNPYPKKDAPAELAAPIKKRWSPVIFSPEAVEPEKLSLLWQAACFAPSCFNEQPWRMIYATQAQPEQFAKLADLLDPGNAWACEAYLLILFTAVPTFARNGKPNRYAAYDTGAAAENLFLQAVELDLVAHEMAGFDTEKARQDLSIPPEVEILAMMAVGHPGDPAAATPEQVERDAAQRERKKISEFVFEGAWQSA